MIFCEGREESVRAKTKRCRMKREEYYFSNPKKLRRIPFKEGRGRGHWVPLGEEEMGFTGFLWGWRLSIVEGFFKGMRSWGVTGGFLGWGFSFFFSDSTLLVKLLGKSGTFWNLGDLHLIAVIVTDFSLASSDA